MAEPITFTEQQKSAYRKAYAPTATDDQWNLFVTECERRALIPGAHVVFNLRPAQEYNDALKQKVSVMKVALITTINALRLIAERSGKYEGHSPFLYYYEEESGEFRETKIPRGRIPHAVSVEGYRTGWRVPLFSVARYDAYVQTKKDGNKDVPTKMWSTRGEEQLAKCCEANMLRAVAPEECGGLYLDVELGVDEPGDKTPLEELKERAGRVLPSDGKCVVVPQATVAPEVNQSAAPQQVLPQTSPFKEVAQATAAQEPRTTMPMKVVMVEPSLFGGTEPIMTPVPVVLPAAAPVPTPAAPEPQTPVTTAPEAPVSPVSSPETSYRPATADERRLWITQKATKIIRDKLPKAGMKNAGDVIKNYLLKGSGQTVLNNVSCADLVRLIHPLEDATPEAAAEIIKAALK